MKRLSTGSSPTFGAGSRTREIPPGEQASASQCVGPTVRPMRPRCPLSRQACNKRLIIPRGQTQLSPAPQVEASTAARSSPTNVAAASGPPPSTSRRTSADPTITPSATRHVSAACSGVDTTDADEDRRVGVTAHRIDDARRGRRGVGPLPRHAHPGDRVDEARVPVGRSPPPGRPASTARRAAPCRRPRRRPRPPTDRSPPARGPGRSPRRCRPRPATGPSAGGRPGRRGCSTSSPPPARRSRAAATPSITACGVVPRSRARTDASWMTGPSIIGSENGMPTSTASAPAATTAWTTSTQSSVIPPITYGTRSFRPPSPRRPRAPSRCPSVARRGREPGRRPCRRGRTA